jgi:DNA-binding XRE family transcriptional regulator
MLNISESTFSSDGQATVAAVSQLHHLTSQEFATALKFLRQSRKWSQEQLAEISGLSTRTIQRAEQGVSSGLAMRAAVIHAFSLENFDISVSALHRYG